MVSSLKGLRSNEINEITDLLSPKSEAFLPNWIPNKRHASLTAKASVINMEEANIFLLIPSHNLL